MIMNCNKCEVFALLPASAQQGSRKLLTSRLADLTCRNIDVFRLRAVYTYPRAILWGALAVQALTRPSWA
jgi:hypothetical protein